MNLLAVVALLVVVVLAAVTPLPLPHPPSSRLSLSSPAPPLLPEEGREIEEELTYMREEGWGRREEERRTHKAEEEERRIQRGREVLYHRGEVHFNVPGDRHAGTHYATSHNIESKYSIANVEKGLISTDNDNGREIESGRNWKEGDRPENRVGKYGNFWSSEENEDSEENERRYFFEEDTDTPQRKRETTWGDRIGEPLVLPYVQDKTHEQKGETIWGDRREEPLVLPYVQDKTNHQDLPDELMPIRPGGGSRFDDLEREKLEREKMAQTKGVEGNTAGTATSHDAESLNSAAASLCLSSFILSSTSFRILL